MIRHFVLVSLITAAIANAADISVTVVDSQNKSIAAAAVSLIPREGERETLTTAVNGSCRFMAVKGGQYFVQASAEGFAASTPRLVDVKSDQSVNVALELGLAELHSSVVVTASGTPQTTDEVSKALTVIDLATMIQRTDISIADALVDVPGLHVQQLGGPLSLIVFKIRGLRDTDTAVLVDGMRLRDAAGTQADATGVLQDLLITDYSRIEVLRGTGSSLYGTDATGGVVNIVTDDGGGRTRGSIGVDGGSLGMVRGIVHLAGGFDHDRIQYSLGATHWNVMSGVEGNSPARDTNLQGQFTFKLSSIAWLSARVYGGDSFGFVRITPLAADSAPSSGIIDARASGPAATFIPDTFDSDSTRVGHFFTGALRFTLRPSDKFAITSQYQNVRTTRDYGNGPAGTFFEPTGSDLADYFGRIQTANVRIDAKLGRWQQFDAGYEFELEDFENLLLPPAPQVKFHSDIKQRSNAVFAQDQLRFFGGRLQIAAGWRAQFFALDRPDFEPAAGSPFAGRSFSTPPTAQTGDVSIAYAFRRTGTKFRTHAGRGYRAPSLYERFGTYFDGVEYTLFGDPGLRPDRSTSIDAGIDQTLWNSRVQLSSTYFYTRLNQVIIFDSSGAVTPLTDPLGRFGGYINTGGGLARGVELSVAVAATRSLQMTGAYTYTDARERTPVIPGVWQTLESPRHQYSFFATEHFSSRMIGVFGYVGSSDYLAPISGLAFRFTGPSRAQASLSYRLPLSEYRAVRFYGKADNLFNQTYFESGFRTPGITAIGGMQFEF